MLPKSTDVEKNISTHFARRAVQGVSLGGKCTNGIFFLFEYWKIGCPGGSEITSPMILYGCFRLIPFKFCGWV